MAIVRPRIPCEGLVAGLSMEEWKSEDAFADSNQESIYKVTERLATAIRDQKKTVVSLQNEITTMKNLVLSYTQWMIRMGTSSENSLWPKCGFRKCMEDWNAALNEAVCKAQPKTISDVVDCEVLKNLLIDE